MTIRRAVFLLLLYFALAWVAVFLYYGDQGTQAVIKPGLFWTAAGLFVVFLFFVVHHLWSWWNAWRIRAQSAPLKPQVAKRHEDDLAFTGLIAEADSRLARAPGAAPRSIRDFPIYLVVGSEGSGKTALLNDAGVDAKLLAGQARGGSGELAGTRVANIWLAGECVFVEICARIFQGDAARLREFLSVLLSPPAAHGWAIWGTARARPIVRGVAYCCDLRPFGKEPDRATIERGALSARERLLTICEVSGTRVPVYSVFTNTDGIDYFAEFFGRMSDSESSQPMGVLVPMDADASEARQQAWADIAGKRLTREFNTLFLRLATRRVMALSLEGDATLKPAIYEFPREFRKLRGSIVQYLVDAWRPDPLALSPLPRGFFFTAKRRVKAAARRLETATQPGGQSAGATVIFRPGLASVGTGAPFSDEGAETSAFTRDFLQTVLRNDQPGGGPRLRVDVQLSRRRRLALTAACVLGSALTLAWTVSWIRNRSLLSEVERSIDNSRSSGRDPLRSLDTLRQLLVARLDQPGPMSMGWGLYTGDDLREGVRAAYFKRLGQLLLIPANARLVDGMNKPTDYDTVYRQLKTHLTVARSACPVDAPLLSRTLEQAVAAVHSEMDPELVRRQIDYYVAALAKTGTARPVDLRADSSAIGIARDYLISKQGPEQMFAGLMAETRKAGGDIKVPENYRSVMAAPVAAPFEFTRDGRAKFEQLVESGKFDLTAEECVFASGTRASRTVASLDQKRRIRAIYYRKYADSWKDFLSKVNFRGYNSLQDVAGKLDVLSSPTSPMLWLIKLTSENTFLSGPAPAPEATNKVAQQVQALNRKATRAKDAVEAALEPPPEFGPANLTTLFQPAQMTVQPDARSLVTEKNKAYVDGLRALQVATDNLNRQISAPDATRDPLIDAVRAALTQARTAGKNLADGFFQETEGVNARVSSILEQPLQMAQFIPRPKPPPGEPVSKELLKTCSDIAPKLAKYPLNQQSAADLTVAELASVFAPGAGAIWQFQTKSLATLVVKNGRRWEIGSPAGGIKVSPELLEFLNRSQEITDAFFPGSAAAPRLEYLLRPVSSQTSKLIIVIDGVTMNTESALQVNFSWPGPDASRGAEGKVRAGGQEFGFAKYPGLWGVFHMFGAADQRALKAPEVVWSQTSGIRAMPQPLVPPVKVQVLSFPGGADVFNPIFFRPVMCPSKAVVTE